MTSFQNHEAMTSQDYRHRETADANSLHSNSHTSEVDLPGVPRNPAHSLILPEVDVKSRAVRAIREHISIANADAHADQSSRLKLIPARAQRIHREVTVAPKDRERDIHQVYTIAWDEESTLCLIVGMGNNSVARRCDNDMINGTKLLNATGMTRGRRDGILKAETNRKVTKVGPAHLKGVWIPFARALGIAVREGIKRHLYPLFEQDIGAFLYHKNNLMRTQQVVKAAQRRRPEFAAWLNGIPKAEVLVGEASSQAAMEPGAAEIQASSATANGTVMMEHTNIDQDQIVVHRGSPISNLPAGPNSPSLTICDTRSDIVSESDIIEFPAQDSPFLPVTLNPLELTREEEVNGPASNTFTHVINQGESPAPSLVKTEPVPGLESSEEEQAAVVSNAEIRRLFSEVERWWYTSF